MTRPDGKRRQVADVRAFNRFYTRLLGLLDERLLDSPVSLTEARVLWEIRARAGIRAEDLIASLGVDRGYMSRILRRLEADGLVSRAPHGNDRRMRVLGLTRPGAAFMRKLDAQASEQIEGLMAGLSAVQQERLVRAMREIQALLGAVDLRGPS